MPDDPETAFRALAALTAERLGVNPDGNSLGIVLGWQTDPGADKGRRLRNWLRDGPPRQMIDLLDMLTAAGLLAPEAEQAWLGSRDAESRAREARRHAEAARRARRPGRRRRAEGM